MSKSQTLRQATKKCQGVVSSKFAARASKSARNQISVEPAESVFIRASLSDVHELCLIVDAVRSLVYLPPSARNVSRLPLDSRLSRSPPCPSAAGTGSYPHRSLNLDRKSTRLNSSHLGI